MIVTCPPAQPAPKRASATAIVQRYRVSCVISSRAPALTGREALARDLTSLRRQLMIDGGRTITPFLALCFRETLVRICDHALELGSLDQAVADNLTPAADRQLIIAYTPLIQSIAAKAHARARLFLGKPPLATANVAILRRAQQQAQRIPRVHTTLREHLAPAMAAAHLDGASLADTLLRIRASLPELVAAEVPSLARHEVQHAIDAGISEAIQIGAPAASAPPLGHSVEISNSTLGA